MTPGEILATCRRAVHYSVRGDNYSRSCNVELPAAMVGTEFLAAIKESRKIVKASLDAWKLPGTEIKKCS
jgi:hypothetical protein